MKSKNFLSALYFSIALILAACSGGGGGGDDDAGSGSGSGGGGGGGGSTSTTLSGSAVKGNVSSGDVNVFRVTNGVQEATPAATTTTSASGAYSAQIPDCTNCIFIVEVSNGNYVDECTGAMQTIPVNQPLRAIGQANGGTAAGGVNPLTEVATRRALANAPNGILDSVTINNANAQVANLFLGLNNAPATILTTIPADGTLTGSAMSSDEERLFGLMLAGFSCSGPLQTVIDQVDQDIAADGNLSDQGPGLNAGINTFLGGPTNNTGLVNAEVAENILTAAQAGDGSNAAPSSDTAITSVAVTNALTISIDSAGSNVSVLMPNGADLTSIAPQISVSLGATIAPASGVAQDFSGGAVAYVVTAEDGTTTENWTVTITAAPDDLSPIANIESINAGVGAGADPLVISAVINPAAMTVTGEARSLTDLDNIVDPTDIFNISAGATIAQTGGSYVTGSVMYQLTAENGDVKDWTVTFREQVPDLVFVDGGNNPINGLDVTFGDADFTVNTDGGQVGVAPTFASSNPGVATIDPASGLVSIVTAGTTILTATQPETATQNATVGQLLLTVNKANQPTLAVPADPLEVLVNETLANAATGGDGTGEITYASANTAIATVDASTGEVTGVSEGSTTITVTRAGDNNFNPVSIVYTVNVSKNDQAPLIFNTAPLNLSFGDNFVNVVTGGSGTGAVTYSSDNATVASVNTNTGAVTALGVGAATITATKAGDNEFNPVSATVLVTVIAANQPALVFANNPLNIIFGDVTPNPATGGGGNGPITYSSDNTAVATVDANTGTVTAVGVGTANITATKAGDGNFNPRSDTAVVNVSPANQPPLTFGSDPLNLVFNDVVTNAASGGAGTGAVTYVSNDTNVVTVNANTGEVTAVGVGTTTVTATKAADANFNEASNSYTVTVGQADQPALTFPVDPLNIDIAATVTNAVNAGGAGTGAITYASGDTGVATVDANTGEVTGVGVGTTSITATKAADANFNERSDSYQVNVGKIDQNPPLSFAVDPFALVFGQSGTNAVNGGQGTGALTFESDDTTVATVNASTGEVTATGVGSATITATKAEDDTFNPSAASYTVNVTPADQAALNFPSDPLDLVFGDTANNTATGGSGTGAITYASNDTNVVTVDTNTGEVTAVGVGSTTVTATKAADANFNEQTGSYTVNVAAANQAPLTFDNDPLTVVVAETASNVVNGGSGTGAITFASNNTAIATVDANSGVITGVAIGSTTITVTKAADANFNEVQGTFTVNVIADVLPGCNWDGNNWDECVWQ